MTLTQAMQVARQVLSGVEVSEAKRHKAYRVLAKYHELIIDMEATFDIYLRKG
jgi:hypothetical protein